MDEKAERGASENPVDTQVSGQDSHAAADRSSQPPSTTRGAGLKRGPRRYLPEAATQPGDTRDTRSGADSSESPPVSARWDATRLPLVDPANYARTEEAGQGGIGLVWKGHDVRLGRTVALKELRESGRGARERFLREALVTARLQHPSIVPVYEAGRWPTGEPFYAMKHVSGESLDHVIENSKTMGQRLALLPHVLAVAEAVAYAHSERILHRDLKPSNVLLGSFGETVVIDWGLAKDLNEAEKAHPPKPNSEAAETKSTGLTLAGSVMGTPAYMPPEQALGLPVDERADVYALGAILYHVLSGSPPYLGSNSKEILKRVLEGPPPPLSKAHIPPDLAALVHTAMARDPARRYPSAKEFAEDLRRYQTGQIVGAHTYSWRERILRFVKRHKAAVMIAAVSALAIAVVSALSLLELVAARRRAEEERDRAAEKQLEAELAQKDAQMHADDLALARANELAQGNPNEALLLLNTLSPWFSNWGAVRTVASNARSWGISREFDHGASVNNVLFLPSRNAILTACDDRIIRLIDLKTGEIREFKGHTDEVYWLYISPDEKQLISSGKDNRVLLWDLQTGQYRGLGDEIQFTAVSDNFSYLAMIGRGALRVIEIASGKTLVSASPMRGASSAAISGNGRHIVLANADELALWDLPSGKKRRGPEVKTNKKNEKLQAIVAISKSGKFAAAARADGQILLWNTIKNKKSQLIGHSDLIDFLAFSPDERSLVSTSRDETVRFWDVETGTSTSLQGHKGKVFALSFSFDGAWVASGGIDKTVRVFSANGREGWILGGATDSVHGISFSPDGQFLAAASGDRRARVWDLGSIGSRILDVHEGSLDFVLPSKDRRSLVYISSDKHVHRLDIEAARKEKWQRASSHEVMANLPANWVPNNIALSPDGRTLAAKMPNASLLIMNIGDGKTKELKTNTDAFLFILFSKDGRTLFSLSDDQRALRWDLESGSFKEIAKFDRKMIRMALSPDERRIAFGAVDGTMQWMPLDSNEFSEKNTIKLLGHTKRISALQFSEKGERLLSGSEDHTIHFWDLGKNQSKEAYLAMPADEFFFLGEHSFLVRAQSSSIKLYENTAEDLGRRLLRLHTAAISAAALSDDGRRLATASEDHTVRLVDMASFQDRPLLGHTKKVRAAFFTVDGTGVISAGADGTVRYWKDDLPFEREALKAWISKAVKERVDVRGPKSF